MTSAKAPYYGVPNQAKRAIWRTKTGSDVQRAATASLFDCSSPTTSEGQFRTHLHAPTCY